MRLHARLVAAMVLWTTATLAGPNDIRISELGNPSLNPASANYVPGANGSFRILARQLGAAITAVNLAPPETLGHAAFAVNLELSVVGLDGKPPPGPGVSPITEGFALPTERAFEGPLLMPSIHVRKGLPFSLELGGRVAWLEKSSMYAGTAEVKWAPMEGFATLPDVGVRLHASRLFNTPDWELGTGGVDLGVGKTFPVGGMVTFTPYAGWNLGFTGASSRLLDFDPQRTRSDAWGSGSSAIDSDVYGTYETVHFFSNPSNRFYAGVRFIGGIVQLGAELSITTFGGFDDETGRRNIPSVGAFNTTLGLDF